MLRVLRRHLIQKISNQRFWMFPRFHVQRDHVHVGKFSFTIYFFIFLFFWICGLFRLFWKIHLISIFYFCTECVCVWKNRRKSIFCLKFTGTFSYLYCFDNKFKIIRYIFIKCMWVMNAKYMRTHTAAYSNQLCSHVHKWNISLYLLHLINKTVIYGHTYEHIKFKIEFNHNKIAAWKYSHDWCYFFQTQECTSDICEMWIVTEAYAYFIHAYILSLSPQPYVWFMIFEISKRMGFSSFQRHPQCKRSYNLIP